MKVLMLIPYPEDGAGNNLYRKFTSQIECTRKVADEVCYTSFDRKNIYFNTSSGEKIRMGKAPIKKQNFLIMQNIMACVREQIIKEKPDIVYMRSITPSFTYKKTMQLMHNIGAKLVTEIPTYPGNNEAKNSSRKLFFAVVGLMAKLFAKGSYERYTDLYTVIGEECHRLNGKKAINIQNGLNVESVPLKKGFTEHKNELRLLGVAALSYWHGYDRVLTGLKQYYENGNAKIKVYFHVCGKSSDGTLEKMMDYVNKNGLNDYVLFEGFLTGDALTQHFDNCDIAIGSLGLHRQSIVVDTTLKLPEYTSRGIPFVYATKSDIMGENDFSLMISGDEIPVDINELISFYEKLDKKNIISQMREFALINIDWSIQMQKTINEVKKLIKEGE